MILSLLVAMTLTPALCATMLKPAHHGPRKGFFGWFNRTYDRGAGAYGRVVGGLLGMRGRAMVAYLVIVGIMGFLFLRLPTAFCSPNFAYLMVSDAHDAVSALNWVHDVQIVLQDHHDADRINRGVAAGLGFSGIYPDEAAAELDALRRVFRLKAHTAFIERVRSGTVTRSRRWPWAG